MHKQLKAATRIISNLKSKVEELTNQNSRVSLDLAQTKKSAIDQQESYRLRSETLMRQIEDMRKDAFAKQAKFVTHEHDEGTGIDADRKVRLAQDQMAKVMAKYRRELQDWAAKYSDLEEKLQICKVKLVRMDCPISLHLSFLFGQEEFSVTENDLLMKISNDDREIQGLRKTVICEISYF